MKEKEVAVASDCNTTPSSAWLIPLSHSWIFKDVVGSAEDAAPDSVKVANVALSICRAEVGIPTCHAATISAPISLHFSSFV